MFEDASARSLRHGYGGGRSLSRDTQIISEGEYEARNDEEERSNGSVSFHNLLKISDFNCIFQ